MLATVGLSGGGVNRPFGLDSLDDGGWSHRSDGLSNHRIAQQIVGSGGHRIGLRVGEIARVDQIQMAQPHRLHRARRRTDIARMGGVAENDSECCQT